MDNQEYIEAHKQWKETVLLAIAKSVRNAEFCEKEIACLSELANAERKYIKLQRDYVERGEEEFLKWLNEHPPVNNDPRIEGTGC